MDAFTSFLGGYRRNAIGRPDRDLGQIEERTIHGHRLVSKGHGIKTLPSPSPSITRHERWQFDAVSPSLDESGRARWRCLHPRFDQDGHAPRCVHDAGGARVAGKRPIVARSGQSNAHRCQARCQTESPDGKGGTIKKRPNERATFCV